MGRGVFVSEVRTLQLTPFVYDYASLIIVPAIL